MSQAMFKNTVTSPVARSFMKRPMNPRSILRRPAALPMSPTTQPVFASFSVMASPTLKSAHVQFMASPQLVATFTTHSSDTYDRAPIRVSPNPLELPGRGDRYFSPALENFRLADPPKPKAAVQRRLDSIIHQQCASPAITDFEDPRSPKVPVDASQSVRFSSFAASPARPARDLQSSISSYPRSPYPSATLPSEVEASEDGVRARRMSDSSVDVSTRPAAVSTAPRKALAPRLPSSLPSIPSPLQQSFRTPLRTPLTAGLQRSHKPAPLAISPHEDATALSDAFWDVMSLQETPMVTALEYPESAMDMEEVNLKSPAPLVKSPGPALIFGTQDGGVWSPSAPKQPAARESLLRSALMSPGKVAFGRVKRSDIAAPSPNDPFASFPSFAAALTMAQSDPTIAYPAPVAVAA